MSVESAGGEERAPGFVPRARRVQPHRSYGAGAALRPSRQFRPRPVAPGCRGRVQVVALWEPREEGAGPSSGRLCLARQASQGAAVTPAATPAPGRLSAGVCAESADLAACSSRPPGAAGGRRHLVRARVGRVGVSWNRAEIRVVQKEPCKRDRWVALGAFTALCGHPLRLGFIGPDSNRGGSRSPRAPPRAGLRSCRLDVSPLEGLDTRTPWLPAPD